MVGKIILCMMANWICLLFVNKIINPSFLSKDYHFHWTKFGLIKGNEDTADNDHANCLPASGC